MPLCYKEWMQSEALWNAGRFAFGFAVSALHET